MTPTAQILFTQANVQTLDPDAAWVDTVAVADGRILAVGSGDELAGLAGSDTQVVSLGGATLLPGFHDAHCHVLGFGQTLALTALTGAGSIPELVRRLEADGERGGWVRGRGYNQNVLAEGRHPTRQDLNAVLGGRVNALVTHSSGHAVAVNSRVLRLANISADTPDPPGGTIVRDGRGEPTGVLLETAVNLAYAVVPEPSRAEKIAALGRASRALNALGITSAVDATLGVAARDSLGDIAVYQDAEQEGALSVRCSLMMTLTQLTAGETVPAPHDVLSPSEFVRLGPAKVFTDGALTTRTARLRTPFLGSDSLGTAVWEAAELEGMAERAHAAGWQIAAHAIGDAAIDQCLCAFGKALARHPRPDARHRIEHAMLLWPDQIGHMARLGVLPVYQPEFLLRFGDSYVDAIGRARADRLMPYAETSAAGLPLIFGSDLPVVPGAPLDGVRAAVSRRTPSGDILGGRQCVPVTDSLRAYTRGAAYSVFAEADRGRIAPGQRADFVVLSADPLTLPPDEWAEGLRVEATIVGGEVVWGQIRPLA